MGSNISHSIDGEKSDDTEHHRSCLRFWKRRKSKRTAHRPSSTELQPTENEPQTSTCEDAPNVNHGSLLSSVPSSTATTTCENEKSGKRGSLQRTLPAIPCSDKDRIEPIYESAPILTELGADLGAPVRGTLSKCDDAPEPYPQTSTHPTDDRGSEVEADCKQENPLGILCTGQESVRLDGGDPKPKVSSTLNVSGHSEEVTSPEEPDERGVHVAASENIYANVDRELDSEIPDVTYMQIDGSGNNGQATRRKATSESNENDDQCRPEAPCMKHDEDEDDYARGDLNVNIAAGKGTQAKTQAIVGPTIPGSRENQPPIVFHPPPVHPGTKRTLNESTTVEIDVKKTKAYILLKTNVGPNYCMFMVRVLLGCLEADAPQQKMLNRLRLYGMEGFQMLEDIEFDLFAADSKSTVSVKISKIQWTDGDILRGDLDPEEFGWRELWNYGSGGAKFWQMSRMTNGLKPEVFAATVHIQQDDRQNIRTKLFRLLESPSSFSEQQHALVDDYPINQSCDKPAILYAAKGVRLGTAFRRSSLCNAADDKKDEIVSLHSDSSVPETRASPPFDRVKKDIERGEAVKPWPTAEGVGLHYI